MNLKCPNSSADFDASPTYFLGDFDIYDREETLGRELNRYDPNDSVQLTEVRRYFFEGGRVQELSVDHKTELLRVLQISLDEDFDFASLLGPGSIADDFVLPGGWQIKNPREFFEQIYREASANWKLKREQWF